MKKIICLLLLALCLLLTAYATGGQPNPASAEPDEAAASAPEVAAPEVETPLGTGMTEGLSQRERDWAEDIDFLRETYKTTHRDPFCLCPEETFDWRLDRLKEKVGELSDVDIYYELKAIIAGMGDNHTCLYPSETLSEQLDSRWLPIHARHFGDRLYLYGYLEGYEQFQPYLLREITAVNGIDIAYLERKVSDIISPFNSWKGKEYAVFYLNDATFLDWAGCGYADSYTLQILNENHEVQTVEAPIVPGEEARKGTVIYPENWDRLFYSRSENWAEYFEGEDGGCVYMSYIKLDSVTDVLMIFDQAEDLIEAHPECRKLAVDLRSNPGGNANRVPQIQACVEQLSRLPIEQTYVITGGYSTSGAIACTAIFQNVMDAVVIGEPTGQFASFFYSGSDTKYVLPHSQCYGYISDGWYETGAEVDAYYDEDGRLYPWENTVLPDVYVYQDIEDIRQGKDSVIEWVLAR